MRQIFVVLWLLVFANKLMGQDVNKNLDFIIVIDEVIPIGTISNIKITYSTSGVKNNINPSYYPGNLSMKNTDYSTLLSDSTKNILIAFDYNEHLNKTNNVYHYQIELKKPWLAGYFSILYIYNLDKKKYKKRFNGVKTDTRYVYELDSPDGTFRVIKNDR